jgi:hypothetical protein
MLQKSPSQRTSPLPTRSQNRTRLSMTQVSYYYTLFALSKSSSVGSILLAYMLIMLSDVAATATEATATNGTPVPKKASNGTGKRKSGAGIPEHKKKTPAKKKKAAPELRLNVSPGEMYMVAMRGYQPWPVIICDEEMLPESLLSKRPVSARRIDGTYRDDFKEGGKNAKDRRYPVMFLGTNEL